MASTIATESEIFAKEIVSEPIRRRISSAASSVGDRKKIQAKQTKFTVIKIRAILRHPSAGFLPPDKLCQALVVARATPCSRPQITKFQLAPCHRPPSSIV